MSHIIGLASIRPSSVDMVFVQVSELENETVFSLDRSLRCAVQTNPKAEWSEILSRLERDGFTSILNPRDNPVFIHSRAWDEHLTGNLQSFFVNFPSSAPYELAGHMMLATPYPLLYASVSADYLGVDKVVVINKDHDPVYADDHAWTCEEHLVKAPIGPMYLLAEQFFSEDEFINAKRLLIASGYEVLCDDPD